MPQPDLFESAESVTLTVSQLTGEIKALLERNFDAVRVEGEISNFGSSASGHCYFTLKDDKAQIPCVIWSSVSRRLGFDPADGQQVVASGEVQVYPPHGKYQLIVRSVEQAGVGALQKAFEKLKAKLKAEGLFDRERKKPLPKFPERIGVITSETGAAFHDICDTVRRRWPLATLCLHHASVQGMNAAPELVRAIGHFSESGDVDVLIIGRGGGSLEDLWPFNEESVARALAACPLPTISAVGHETDFSICDFVADARAATPTQAGSLATPDINEHRLYVDDLSMKILDSVPNFIKEHRRKVEQLLKSHALMAIRQKVLNYRNRCTTLGQRLKQCRGMLIARRREKVGRLEEQIGHRHQMGMMRRREKVRDLRHRLEKLDMNAPLERGFVRVHQDGQWVRRAGSFDTDSSFQLEWRDKRVELN